MSAPKRKSALRQELERTRQAAGLLSVALNLSMNGKPDASARALGTAAGESYTLRLYGAKRADGGVVLSTFRFAGQSDFTSAHYLEELRRDTQLPILYRLAVENLYIQRNRIVEARERGPA